MSPWTNAALSAQSPAKLYFGYGSNLWINQMHARCPSSHYVGIGCLRGYKWIINARGYANIVELPEGADDNEVWGMIFYLTPDDESRLDRNEGVPVSYTKEMLKIDFWRTELENLNRKTLVEGNGVRKDVLVYIDRKRVEEALPRDEYVLRMNHGIADALSFGVPERYVQRVMRRFIPEETVVDSQTKSRAQQQAQNFRDSENEDL